ncbi:MAG: M15 family metallopeptidase [Erysipelotrichaceae bacterium]
MEIEYNPKDKKANYRVVDSSKNQTVLEIKVSEEGPPIVVTPNIEQPSTSQGVQPTFINGILLVNKRYAIPASYISPQKDEAYAALQQMLAAASQSGHSMPILSGHRSYSYQQSLFQRYVNSHGLAAAETFSARAGHSEHQTGLAYDITVLSSDFANTATYGWLQENAASFGFVERYPSGKTHITGYIFEPWHYRYVGVSHALAIKASGLTLEEYLGVA